MPQYADRVKDTATTTGTGAITLAGLAAAGFRTFGSSFTVGDLVPYSISSQSGSEWEVGVGTLTAATTLARTTVTASSSAGSLVNFSAGTKDVACTLNATELEKLAGASSDAVTTVPDNATTYLLVVQNGIPKKITIAALLAEIGVAAPSLAAAGALASGNIVTITQDGVNEVRTTLGAISTFFGSGTPTGDTIVPTVTAATVANASPTIVALTASETLDPAYVPAAAAFTVGGHTVSAVAISGATINLTVDAFVNGEAARTVAYTQTGTNNIRDTAGNLLANFAGRAITNNVGAVATVPAAPTIGTAVAGDGYVDVHFTRNGNGGSAVLDSTATLSTGQTATSASSPIRVTAPNATAVTATVKDRNAVGSSAASSASNSVTPVAAASYTYPPYNSNAVKAAILPSTGSLSDGYRYYSGTDCFTNIYWGVEPAAGAGVVRGGWGTSATVEPPILTTSQNTAAGGKMNGLLLLNAGGTNVLWNLTASFLWALDGQQSVPMFYWLKVGDAPGYCLNSGAGAVVQAAG